MASRNVICEGCGKEFVTPHYNQIYCNKEKCKRIGAQKRTERSRRRKGNLYPPNPTEYLHKEAPRKILSALMRDLDNLEKREWESLESDMKEIREPYGRLERMNPRDKKRERKILKKDIESKYTPTPKNLMRVTGLGRTIFYKAISSMLRDEIITKHGRQYFIGKFRLSSRMMSNTYRWDVIDVQKDAPPESIFVPLGYYHPTIITSKKIDWEKRFKELETGFGKYQGKAWKRMPYEFYSIPYILPSSPDEDINEIFSIKPPLPKQLIEYLHSIDQCQLYNVIDYACSIMIKRLFPDYNFLQDDPVIITWSSSP